MDRAVLLLGELFKKVSEGEGKNQALLKQISIGQVIRHIDQSSKQHLDRDDLISYLHSEDIRFCDLSFEKLFEYLDQDGDKRVTYDDLYKLKVDESREGIDSGSEDSLEMFKKLVLQELSNYQQLNDYKKIMSKVKVNINNLYNQIDTTIEGSFDLKKLSCFMRRVNQSTDDQKMKQIINRIGRTNLITVKFKEFKDFMKFDEPYDCKQQQRFTKNDKFSLQDQQYDNYIKLQKDYKEDKTLEDVTNLKSYLKTLNILLKDISNERNKLALQQDFNLFDFYRLFDQLNCGQVLFSQFIDKLQELDLYINYEQAHLLQDWYGDVITYTAFSELLQPLEKQYQEQLKQNKLLYKEKIFIQDFCPETITIFKNLILKTCEFLQQNEIYIQRLQRNPKFNLQCSFNEIDEINKGFICKQDLKDYMNDDVEILFEWFKPENKKIPRQNFLEQILPKFVAKIY